METQVEHHAVRSGGGNLPTTKPSMFHAGLSNKFTKRHTTNFHDTTLTAASAAKARAELKMERQANAIEKQQEKIEQEMKKIEQITERLQRQQAREAKRLRRRLEYAASRIQAAYRNHVMHQVAKCTSASIEIQRHWRGHIDRQHAASKRRQRDARIANQAASTITRAIRIYVCRLIRKHELMWRDYAATTIQCVVRQHQAVLEVSRQRELHRLHVRLYHAATKIQANVRGFHTRMVYLDVLYLIIRIQAVGRGYLVRSRLQWLLAFDVQPITSIQALVRGFLARRRLGRLQVLRPQPEPRTAVTRPQRPVHRPIDKKPAQRQATVPYNLITTHVSVPSPIRSSPERAKRSFWLPSGSTTSGSLAPRRRRPQISLPTLASLSPTPCLGIPSPRDVDPNVSTVSSLRRPSRGKQGKPRPPARLHPIDRSIQPATAIATSMEKEASTEDEQRQRIEQQRLKLLIRKAQERMRLEREERDRIERAKEMEERRIMDREDKAVRLLLKATQRKHHELRQRRLAMEQQREEHERMDMMREERLTKLHLKMLARVSIDSVDMPSLPRKQPKHRVAEAGDDRNEDGKSCVVLLDQDKRHQSHARHPGQKASKTKGKEKPSKLMDKKTRELRAVYQRGNQRGSRTHHHPLLHLDLDANLQRQYAAWDFHNDSARSTEAEMVEDDAEFDYGDEFEDVVDETQLKRLLC